MTSKDTFHAIAALDLTPIKLKLMHEASGAGWSQAKANAMEIEYRRFLYLQAIFSHEQTAPTMAVDTFWHYHILDTMKYASDCEQAFGYFLHHYPYTGMMEGDEPGAEIEAGNRMRELYEATFGEAYIRAEAYGEDDNRVTEARGPVMCTVAAPQATGQGTALCQGFCVVRKPVEKAAKSALCQGACTVSKSGTASSISAH